MVTVDRRHRRRWLALGVTSLVLVVAVATGAWALYLNHQLGQVQRIDVDLGGETAAAAPAPSTEQQSDEQRTRQPVTILVAGVDGGSSRTIAEDLAAGEWQRGSHRTDTIMVVHLTADREEAYVVSIPRDSWVHVDGYGKRKINAAFSFGGPQLFVDTVQQLTRAEIDHLAILDWAGFKDLTRAIGGVKVYIPERVHDRSQEVTWTKGTHLLEGKRALQYVRTRHGLVRGDLGRIDRQQNFLRATLNKLLSNGTLANPIKVTNVVEAVTDHLTVDDGLSDADLRGLAMSVHGIDREDVHFLTVPTRGTDRVDGRSIVRVDRAETRELFAALEQGRMPAYLQANDVDRLPGRRNVD